MLDQLRPLATNEETLTMKTSLGDLTIRLFPDRAPKACENFRTHAKDGYYDGLTFHRVIRDFCVQGGDPTGTGMGGESIWKKSFEDEFDPTLHNYYGALSMANSGPDTNGSQFFFVVKKDVPGEMIDEMEKAGEAYGFPPEVVDAYMQHGGTPWLDFRHTVFGQVVEGLDVLEKLAAVETDGMDRPIEALTILSIEGSKED